MSLYTSFSYTPPPAPQLRDLHSPILERDAQNTMLLKRTLSEEERESSKRVCLGSPDQRASHVYTRSFLVGDVNGQILKTFHISAPEEGSSSLSTWKSCMKHLSHIVFCVRRGGSFPSVERIQEIKTALLNDLLANNFETKDLFVLCSAILQLLSVPEYQPIFRDPAFLGVFARAFSREVLLELKPNEIILLLRLYQFYSHLDASFIQRVVGVAVHEKAQAFPLTKSIELLMILGNLRINKEALPLVNDILKKSSSENLAELQTEQINFIYMVLDYFKMDNRDFLRSASSVFCQRSLKDLPAGCLKIILYHYTKSSVRNPEIFAKIAQEIREDEKFKELASVDLVDLLSFYATLHIQNPPLFSDVSEYFSYERLSELQMNSLVQLSSIYQKMRVFNDDFYKRIDEVITSKFINANPEATPFVSDRTFRVELVNSGKLFHGIRLDNNTFLSKLHEKMQLAKRHNILPYHDCGSQDLSTAKLQAKNVVPESPAIAISYVVTELPRSDIDKCLDDLQKASYLSPQQVEELDLQVEEGQRDRLKGLLASGAMWSDVQTERLLRYISRLAHKPQLSAILQDEGFLNELMLHITKKRASSYQTGSVIDFAEALVLLNYKCEDFFDDVIVSITRDQLASQRIDKLASLCFAVATHQIERANKAVSSATFAFMNMLMQVITREKLENSSGQHLKKIITAYSKIGAFNQSFMERIANATTEQRLAELEMSDLISFKAALARIKYYNEALDRRITAELIRKAELERQKDMEVQY